MYNLLIADDNLEYVKQLANHLLHRVNFVKLVKITTDGEETYNCLKTEHIDLLLLDLKMPKYSGIEVLKKAYQEKLENYPKVIVVSGEMEILDYKQLAKYNVVKCLYKNIGLNEITISIMQILDEFENEDKIKNWSKCISKELTKLNYNFKHSGTQYIKECVLYILDKNDINLINNLEKNVYTHIAKTHNKTVGNIKNNIVKATNNMYMECEINYLLNYFDFKSDKKPTPKMVILKIISNIKNN